MQIYSNSPIALAILKLFRELEEWISLYHHNLPNGAIKDYIFGGCAFHLHTNARGSNDIDAEIQAIQQLKKQDILLFLENNDVEYIDHNHLETNLEFDRSFNTALASIDPDYIDRVIPLHTSSIVEVYLVSGVDLATSKLARLSDQDIEDIKTLYLKHKFTLDQFKKSANNAKDYYAIPEQLDSNIRYMTSVLSSLKDVR